MNGFLAEVITCWVAILVFAGIVLVMYTDAGLGAQARLARLFGIPCKNRVCTLPRFHQSPHLHLVLVEKRQTGSFRRAA